MKKVQCNYCKKETVLRPYGKDGVMICYECSALPENVEETIKQFKYTFQDKEGFIMIANDKTSLLLM